MKKHFLIHRLISFALVVALLTSIFASPASAATNNDGEYTLLEVQSETKLKKDCYADSKTIEVVSEKTLLYAVDSTVNKYNNVWFQVLYASDEGSVSEAFVYGGDVRAHECEFATQGDDCVTVRYCRCGQIQVTDELSGETQPVYADALNPTGILPKLPMRF